MSKTPTLDKLISDTDSDGQELKWWNHKEDTVENAGAEVYSAVMEDIAIVEKERDELLGALRRVIETNDRPVGRKLVTYQADGQRKEEIDPVIVALELIARIEGATDQWVRPGKLVKIGRNCRDGSMSWDTAEVIELLRDPPRFRAVTTIDGMASTCAMSDIGKTWKEWSKDGT